MGRILDYSYIVATISLPAYGRLILKARVACHGALPSYFGAKLWFLLRLLFDLLIFSGFVAGFLASISWVAAMTKFDTSHAYPFMILNFVLVLELGGWLLSEPITLQKLVGISLIVLERRSRRESRPLSRFVSRANGEGQVGGPRLVIGRWREWSITKFHLIGLT
jgi:hypothetical protein